MVLRETMPGLLFMRRKAIVFIDGSNFYHNVKSVVEKSKKIDYVTLSQCICDRFNLDLEQIRYYNSIPDISDGEDVYYKHIEFLESLKALSSRRESSKK